MVCVTDNKNKSNSNFAQTVVSLCIAPDIFLPKISYAFAFLTLRRMIFFCGKLALFTESPDPNFILQYGALFNC